jgi:hypothetical protein
MIDTVKTIRKLSLILIIIGVASAQAGTVHSGRTTVHTTGHGNYHGNYYGGHGYYAHGGHGYYANGGQRYYNNGGHNARYWHGGYYGGRYYDGGYYPYNSPFFIGLPLPVPFFFPGFN